MEGITILSTEIVTLGMPFWVGPLIGCVVFIVVLLSQLAADSEIDGEGFSLGAAVGILVMLLFIMISAATIETQTRYKVLIDETVPFVEFNKQYEVIDQEGEIYIVREKEGNKND